MNASTIDALPGVTPADKEQLKRYFFKPNNEGGDAAKGMALLQRVAPQMIGVAKGNDGDAAGQLVRLAVVHARRTAAILGESAREALEPVCAALLEACEKGPINAAELAKEIKGSGGGFATLRAGLETAAELQKQSKGSDKKK